MRDRHTAGMIELFERQPKRRFQADDAERAALELLHFFVAGMRGMVGGDGVDRAVDQASW